MLRMFPCTGARPHRAHALLVALAAAALALVASCGGPSLPPRHYLVVTHSALNRVTFYDLDANRIVGALPTEKLPHDMLLAPDGRSLDVFCSGAQCVMRFHLDSPELWRRARAFIVADTARARRPRGMTGMGARPHAIEADGRDSLALTVTATPEKPVFLHPDPVQQLPREVAEVFLTDPAFPDTAKEAHARVRAADHRTCYDCHITSRGAKPFGPVPTRDGKSVLLVHLAGRSLTVLDAATLAVRRTIPLELPQPLQPIEVWNRPGTDTAYVTCRNEIGESRPGRILVVDLRSGHTVASIESGIFPWHLLPDGSGGRLYVNNFQSSRISILDLDRQAIVDSIVVQNGPSTMALSPGGDRLLVSCFYTHKLLVVDPARRAVTGEVAVGSNPTTILFTQDPDEVFVLCGGESDLERIKLSQHAVVERHPMLFGAYAALLVDRDHSGRWIVPAAPVADPRTDPGARP